MSLILDAGALIAVERGDRVLVQLLKRSADDDESPVTHGGVVGQVWRGGARQAKLATLMSIVVVHPLDDELGRRAGVLLARSGTIDVIDAALVLLARRGDMILTSDPGDLQQLIDVTGLDIDVVPV